MQGENYVEDEETEDWRFLWQWIEFYGFNFPIHKQEYVIDIRREIDRLVQIWISGGVFVLALLSGFYYYCMLTPSTDFKLKSSDLKSSGYTYDLNELKRIRNSKAIGNERRANDSFLAKI